MQDATRQTLAQDAFEQWALRRASIGMTQTIAATYTSEFLADQRIAASRERRLSKK
jgi:hypothetical protein